MIGLPLGGSAHVIIGPHDDLVTRSLHNFGTLPTSAVLVPPRGTGTAISLGVLGTFDYLFAHYGGPNGGTGEVWVRGRFEWGHYHPPNRLPPWYFWMGAVYRARGWCA